MLGEHPSAPPVAHTAEERTISETNFMVTDMDLGTPLTPLPMDASLVSECPGKPVVSLIANAAQSATNNATPVAATNATPVATNTATPVATGNATPPASAAVAESLPVQDRTTATTSKLTKSKSKFKGTPVTDLQSFFGSDDWVRFFVYDSDMTTIELCEDLHKTLKGRTKIDRRHDGKYQIEVDNKQASLKLLERIHNTKGRSPIVPHSSLNFTVGTTLLPSNVTIRSAFPEAADELTDHLRLFNKGVEEVYPYFGYNRRTKKRDLRIMKIKFRQHTVPSTVFCCGQVLYVREFLNPLKQCRSCWKFHHVTKHCKGRSPICENCGKPTAHHPSPCTFPSFCSNCRGNHKATSKSCQKLLFEKKVNDASQKFRLSRRETIDRLRANNEVPKATYAQKVKSTPRPNLSIASTPRISSRKQGITHSAPTIPAFPTSNRFTFLMQSDTPLDGGDDCDTRRIASSAIPPNSPFSTSQSASPKRKRQRNRPKPSPSNKKVRASRPSGPLNPNLPKPSANIRPTTDLNGNAISTVRPSLRAPPAGASLEDVAVVPLPDINDKFSPTNSSPLQRTEHSCDCGCSRCFSSGFFMVPDKNFVSVAKFLEFFIRNRTCPHPEPHNHGALPCASQLRQTQSSIGELTNALLHNCVSSDDSLGFGPQEKLLKNFRDHFCISGDKALGPRPTQSPASLPSTTTADANISRKAVHPATSLSAREPLHEPSHHSSPSRSIPGLSSGTSTV